MKNHNLSVKIALTIALLLFLTLGTSSYPKSEIRTEPFVDWCTNKENLRAETRYTVDLLLEEVATEDCHQAERILTNREKLDLSANRIKDI
ncbi:MAG: leucine-rich repeat domain-containing protein, partial [Symploca sp. SIO2D2]|nr:leucine-rich repeat domain-containing protein [Symploca sp. SIO2D2]